MKHIEFVAGTVVTRYETPVEYEQEFHYHMMLPTVTPRLVKAEPENLVLRVEEGEPLGDITPGPLLDEVAELIAVMTEAGVHHRDCHPGNLVMTDSGVKLIDWETACYAPGLLPYDLYGPVEVPVPVQHGGLLPQWWKSRDRGSIQSLWGVEPPSWLFERVIGVVYPG